ncbi:MAG TPA: hypothetical protein VER03_22475 [Bryobacteraceae bacterium]|nr:hypothetical protein [Bryobacteraceae bacterium]
MRNRYALVVCMLGLSLLTGGCYNNPEVSSKHPGEGADDIHSRPQVGPGTTSGGSTAGPQPAAREHGKSDVQPTPSGATGDAPGLDHAGAATPNVQPGAAHTPAGTQSRTGNEKGVGDRSSDGSTHGPAKH